MTTVCMPITPARGTRSLLSTVPETGRGQASLWTAAAAPDHSFGQPYGVRWTPPGCPLAPSHDDGGVPPGTYQSQPITRRDDLRTLLQAPVAEPALVNIDSPQTGGPFPSIKVAIPACQNQPWAGSMIARLHSVARAMCHWIPR